MCVGLHEADRYVTNIYIYTRAWIDESLARPLIEGLHKVGYKTNYGEDGSGFLFLALKRAGGYYLGMS